MGTIYFALRGDGSAGTEERERVHRPKPRGAWSGRKVVVVGMFVPGNEEDLIEDVRGGLFSPRIIRCAVGTMLLWKEMR